MVSECQLSILLPEGKHMIKRQLYSGPFSGSFTLVNVALPCLYYEHM